VTLKEWAEREGLVYLNNIEYPPLLDEYMCTEVVYNFRHCLDCADWYIYRDRDGTLRKYVVLGDSSMVVMIEDKELDGITKSDFEEEQQ